MFLLNSRALLGTIGYDFHHSQVLFRSYNSNWPNSLNHYYTMAIGYSPRRPDAVIGTGTCFFRIYKVAGFMDHTHTRWPRRARLCRLSHTLRQLTCFRGAKNCHTGKRSLPLGERVADNHFFRCRSVHVVTQYLAYSLSPHYRN